MYKILICTTPIFLVRLGLFLRWMKNAVNWNRKMLRPTKVINGGGNGCPFSNDKKMLQELYFFFTDYSLVPICDPVWRLR